MKKTFNHILTVIAVVTVMLILLGGGMGMGYGIGWKHAMMAVANSEIRGKR